MTPGISPGVHCTSDSSVRQLVAREEVNAAISIFPSPLLLPSHTHTHIIFFEDGSIKFEVATIGSVAFTQYAVQVALQY